MALLKRSRYKYLGFPLSQLQRIAIFSALQRLLLTQLAEQGMMIDAQALTELT